jgi:mono/diheme cytochrome c family protein
MTDKFHRTLAAAVAVAALAALASRTAAKPISYQLPPETAALKPGPGLDAVQSNCGACHSADYITTQPRGPKFGKEFWNAEVTKMIKVYGAPIQESDIKPIVDYLATNY